MDFTAASIPSLVCFVGILLAVVAALLWAVGRAYRSAKPVALTALALAAWLGIQSALIMGGRMASLPLNGLPFFFGSIVVVSVGAALSPFGGKLASGVPIALLVAFHIFRLPLELVLHAWAADGTIPQTMTWTGRNWDVIGGFTALVCAPLAGRHRVAARLFNIVGFALLLNVMHVALRSSPLPFGWNVRPPLLLALHLPYAYIGPICVGGALFGHLVLARALVTKKSRAPSS